MKKKKLNQKESEKKNNRNQKKSISLVTKILKMDIIIIAIIETRKTQKKI